jgi:hypothetical protein
MILGLRIKSKKVIEKFHYKLCDWDKDRLDIYFNNKGTGNYDLLESFDINNEIYLVFGYKEGNKFNTFDLASINSYGDIIITKVNNEKDFTPIDIKKEEIDSFYKGIDIESDDDYSIGSYDYDDDFIVDDRE